MFSLSGLCVCAYAAAAGIPAQGPGYKAFDVSIDSYGMHLINVDFGDSQVPCVIDTGSTTFWIRSQVYQPSANAVSLNKTFDFSYLSAVATGNATSDTIAIGDLTVKDFPFGVIGDIQLPYQALVGLAPAGSEAGISPSSYVDGKLTNDYYDTFLMQLKNQGDINSAAFSLWSNGAAPGSLIFGGVDTTKYSGTLTTVPLLKTISYNEDTGESWTPGEPFRYAVALNSVSVQNCSCATEPIVSGAHLPVVLDSGSTQSIASPEFVEAIFLAFNSTDRLMGFDDQSHMYFTDSVPEGNLIFDFSGALISVPIADLFMQTTGEDGSTMYAFTILVNDMYTDIDNDGRAIQLLGAGFLNSAYIVFDAENNEVSLAQANHGDISDQSIVAIGSASSTKAPRYSETAWNGQFETHTASLFN